MISQRLNAYILFDCGFFSFKHLIRDQSKLARQSDSVLLTEKHCRVKNNLQLIETRFTKSLDLQAHIAKLTQHRSIPLFLSDVTSDLFHRQTVVGYLLFLLSLLIYYSSPVFAVNTLQNTVRKIRQQRC